MRIAALTSLLLCVAAPALATGTVLTVTGPAQTREYDLAGLEALEARDFDTSTIWTEGVPTFTGVPLKALLLDAGITTGHVVATAINDYAVEIPVKDIGPDYPIIAYRMNGETMSVRDKGPLWVVYPYDSSPDFRSEVVYSRSIWQLDRLAGGE